MPLGESLQGLAALRLALALASVGLGMLPGMIARTSKQAGHINMVVGFLLYCASGSTAGSVSSTGFATGLEGFRLSLSQLTPHAHTIDGFTRLILEGAGLVGILPSILVLLGVGAVCFLLGMRRFEYE